MNVESYNTSDLSDDAFEFYSDGPKGTFRMEIDIAPIPEKPGLYNLGFAVWNEEIKGMDDTMQTNNGDADLILGTVAKKALEFLDRNKKANLIATGSLPKGKELRARTRLYQRGINAHYDYLSERYNVYGLIADRDENGKFIGKYPFWRGKWDVFAKGTNYDAFLLNLK